MEQLLDKQGLADWLNVPVGWVEKATAARQVPITWVGKHARYDPADIRAWLASNKEAPSSPMPALRLVQATTRKRRVS
ncbi:MAG TPA: hypothetical protein VKZ82_24155 [Nonomuraea sp.]|nr:hypothetical protein [Nonomuraea sp.]